MQSHNLDRLKNYCLKQIELIIKSCPIHSDFYDGKERAYSDVVNKLEKMIALSEKDCVEYLEEEFAKVNAELVKYSV